MEMLSNYNTLKLGGRTCVYVCGCAHVCLCVGACVGACVGTCVGACECAFERSSNKSAKWPRLPGLTSSEGFKSPNYLAGYSEPHKL